MQKGWSGERTSEYHDQPIDEALAYARQHGWTVAKAKGGSAIKGELSDDRLDALFEAGCDDATFSTGGGVTFAAFDREAPSLLDAVLSAIEAEPAEENGVEIASPTRSTLSPVRRGAERQRGGSLGDGRSTRSAVRVGPAPGHEVTVPAQQGCRLDEEVPYLDQRGRAHDPSLGGFSVAVLRLEVRRLLRNRRTMIFTRTGHGQGRAILVAH